VAWLGFLLLVAGADSLRFLGRGSLRFGAWFATIWGVVRSDLGRGCGDSSRVSGSFEFGSVVQQHDGWIPMTDRPADSSSSIPLCVTRRSVTERGARFVFRSRGCTAPSNERAPSIPSLLLVVRGRRRTGAAVEVAEGI
jgi:hypothetical protein